MKLGQIVEKPQGLSRKSSSRGNPMPRHFPKSKFKESDFGFLSVQSRIYSIQISLRFFQTFSGLLSCQESWDECSCTSRKPNSDRLGKSDCLGTFQRQTLGLRPQKIARQQILPRGELFPDNPATFPETCPRFITPFPKSVTQR